MEKVYKIITDNNLIKKGETIGVAVSGGQDSMALLHYLSMLQIELDFEIVAIHVDHSLRETSAQDALFVINYCKQHHIRAYKFKVDVKELSKQNGLSIETAARDARYGVFQSIVARGIVDKVALAHHAQDQAETILLHLFRGSGISGARGMELEKQKIYIRPMLSVSKEEIIKYVNDNEIPFVEDETNYLDTFQRNYIRNKILPMIINRFPGAISSLNNFAQMCKEDDDYINSQVVTDALIIDKEKTVKIPCTYFLNPKPISTRLIFKALDIIGVYKDVERKHIEIISELALRGKNGSKIKLPMDVSVYKEYDYVTITNEQKERKILNVKFRCGTFEVENFGKVTVKKVDPKPLTNSLIIDGKKLPKDAVWRFRREGDYITKFGGGTQKIKTYLSQKKIPLRQRDFIPVLALDSEVFVVAGFGISEKVKIDKDSKNAYEISVL